jgi:glycosidase
MIIFDSQNERFKSPIGPVKENLEIKICLSRRLNPDNVRIEFLKQGINGINFSIPMEMFETDSENLFFSTTIKFTEVATYDYYFSFSSNDKKYYVRRKYGEFEGFISEENCELPWRLTVYKPIKTHEAMNKGIMYQIFPDRFSKGKIDKKLLPKDRIYREWGEEPYYDNENVTKDFFGGNFQGIADKIDYLKRLHVSVIYSNPICLSSSNHRYDAIDYKEVDPVLGTKDDFKKMLSKLHKAGIIFVQDAVLNHVGADSIYFDRYNKYHKDGAYQSTKSKYRDWFYFDEEDPKKYSSWWGFENLPKLNYQSDSLKKYIFGKKGVFESWYENGIDGIRLDVADELSNEILKEIYNISEAKRGNKKIVIPEVWEDASLKWSYGHLMEYLLGNQATSVMNYPVRDSLVEYVRYGEANRAYNFKSVCNEIFKENYPKEIAYSLMNFLSTHDTIRAITKFAGPEIGENGREWQAENNKLSKEAYKLGRERLMLAYLVIFFLPGIPSIYYGDEIGMQGMKDPFCRGCFEWNKIDKKILHFFKRLASTRFQNQEFLSKSDFNILMCEDRFLLFERTFGNRKLKICLNFSKYNMDITPIFVKQNVNLDKVETDIKNVKIIFRIKENLLNDVFRRDEYGDIKAILTSHNAIVYEEIIDEK